MSAIKDLIDSYIKSNGLRDITGPILNTVLNAMIDYNDQKGDQIFFIIGDGEPGTPANGATSVVIPEMDGRKIIYDCSNGGPLKPGVDFKRQKDGIDNPLGDTVILLVGGIPAAFLTGDKHRITLL